MLSEFLLRHPVFTYDEFTQSSHQGKARSLATTKSLLQYYIKKGYILSIKRGLYATCWPLQNAASAQIDPFLIAAKLTEDAVLAYHTALEFQGKGYSVFWQMHYFTQTKPRPLTFQSHTFQGIAFPAALVKTHRMSQEVISVQREHLTVRVTSLERTLVDMLDRIELSGGWEEVWRSFESVTLLKVERLVEYALLLDNATLAAKVGFYLELRQVELMLDEHYLTQLAQYIPRSAHYLQGVNYKAKEQHHYVKRWHLMVPESVLVQSWDELNIGGEL